MAAIFALINKLIFHEARNFLSATTNGPVAVDEDRGHLEKAEEQTTKRGTIEAPSCSYVAVESSMSNYLPLQRVKGAGGYSV